MNAFVLLLPLFASRHVPLPGLAGVAEAQIFRQEVTFKQVCCLAVNASAYL